MTYSQPDVSLIVPCYKQARYLAGLFESLRQATNLLIEIIIIDDGNPDDDIAKALGLVNRTKSRHPLVLRRTMNCGLSAARNIGIQLARGRYIKFLDSDDLLLPDALETQVGELDLDETADLHLIGYCTGVEDLSSFSVFEPSTLPTQNLTPSYVASAWEIGLSIPIHTALFRTSSLNGLSFNEELEAKEDWLFWHAVAQKEMKLLINPQIGVVYRSHPTSMTKNRSRMAQFWLKAIESMILSGTQLNSDEESNILRYFNEFYLPALNFGFYEELPENFIDSVEVHIPLILATNNDLN
jgi:glycosyltransferase involved in cell wall biosynthesis